ncbi:Hsp70 family protein [Pseudarthrobacter sp. NBSH8]|uniref:Hsp70 family protein n=1 Tax=Pseudarthrobacter sp. NBSH8 TaxID=2596911 RepID=UPI001625DE56|nr:Hsp70 family protein [Pseudarthrobacter sp. NBSH8]QNE15714.1 Hsp70 family protein [Pseudarthrobacter sp. NBSH8]
MNYVLAIDVGTSFTAAALLRLDQNAPRVPETLPLGLRGSAVPSVVYFPEEGPVLVGEAAERRGLDFPERVVREFKRRVGDEVPIAVGTLQLPAQDVFATMARWVADRAEEREGAPPSAIILSHPASWGAHRTQLILAALAAKGLEHVMLVSEPEAAALHYAAQVRVEDGSTIAVYDLGGGTFDTAVLRKADSGQFELLGRPVGIEGLGGADFDASVMQHVAAHAGQGLAGLDPAEPGALAALARLRRECVEAKEALSADCEASIPVLLPGIQQQVRLVRAEFEAMISELIRETLDALGRYLQDLGLTPEDLSAVLLIGGSSRIPLVAQLISEELDRPIAVDADPKSSICLGATIAALRSRPELTAKADVTAQPDNAVQAAARDARRPASWSRKPGAAVGSIGGTAGAGTGAGATRHVGAHAPRARTGAHSSRPTARLTAVAAAAALFTVLSATAAQSPGGLESLTAMLAPPAAGAAKADAAGSADAHRSTPGGAAGGGAGAAAGKAGAAQKPSVGIEASSKKPTAPASGAGIEAAASPTALPPASPAAGGAAPGSTSGAGATSGPTGLAAAGTTAGTPTPDPTTNPPAMPTTTDPTIPPPTTTDPTIPPPTTTDPTADPTTDPPTTTDPLATRDPSTTQEPSVEPDPTTLPAPEPTTEPPASAPTVTEPAA